MCNLITYIIYVHILKYFNVTCKFFRKINVEQWTPSKSRRVGNILARKRGMLHHYYALTQLPRRFQHYVIAIKRTKAVRTRLNLITAFRDPILGTRSNPHFPISTATCSPSPSSLSSFSNSSWCFSFGNEKSNESQ